MAYPDPSTPFCLISRVSMCGMTIKFFLKLEHWGRTIMLNYFYMILVTCQGYKLTLLYLNDSWYRRWIKDVEIKSKQMPMKL